MQVWKISCSSTAVTATEGRFSCHRCPALQGVVVSVSKMGREDKEMVRKAVTNHGGTYSPSLEKDQTTVLVTPSASGSQDRLLNNNNSSWNFDIYNRVTCCVRHNQRCESVVQVTSTWQPGSGRSPA